jgi:hypothetical protein
VVAAVELPVTDEGEPGEGRSCGQVKLPTFWELDEHKGATGQLLRSESARLGFPPRQLPPPGEMACSGQIPWVFKYNCPPWI